MALMTDERRKEMEEEMNRFEQEIAIPGEPHLEQRSTEAKSEPATNDKITPLQPPPMLPVLNKSLPPPNQTSQQAHAPLRPPPPPPNLQPRSSANSVRFIPHQVNRSAPRPQMRPNFMPMRGPMMGPPGPFPHPGPFGPHMNQGPPMGEHMGPSGPMHPMPPMHHIAMPSGYCSGPRPYMGPMGSTISCDPQSYMPQDYESVVSAASMITTNNGQTIVVTTPAPAVYAAPFVKNPNEEVPANSEADETEQSSSPVSIIYPKNEKLTKSDEPTVGPAAPNASDDNYVSKKKEKKRKVVRMAGGQAWEDNSLQEWETDDFRIFCGDLGNDVTDEVLIRAFSKYNSFVKAKVIRDKRTNKTKGYGFVSFKDPQDFIKAMREMNGRYVGSRPIKLRKSTWRDRNIDIVKRKQKEKEKLGLL